MSNIKTRREFLKTGMLTVAGISLINPLKADSFQRMKPQNSFVFPLDGQFVLPKLEFDYASLEPHIDAQTMQLHHDKHHQTYVTKLNEALERAPELKNKSLDELLRNLNNCPESVKTAIRNHGGGHWNHTFFWKILNPKSSETVVSEELINAMIKSFTDMDNFKSEFNKSATSVFGSGWTWVIKDKNNNLSIVNTPNQDNPIMDISATQGKPIFGVDVWEHAYYLKYTNKRADYLNAIWNVIDWNQVSKLYSEN